MSRFIIKPEEFGADNDGFDGFLFEARVEVKTSRQRRLCPAITSAGAGAG
jgi:hypothetical protein